MKLPVCFLGFGEAGQSFCSDKRWQGEAYGCDVKLEQDDNRLAKLNDFERFGVKAIEPVDTLSNGSNLILSVVTADQALKAAERVASFLKSGTLYLDMNSAAPTTKQTAATLMHDKGIDYIDVAIMSPVIPKKLDVPLLLAGVEADLAKSKLSELGFQNIRIVGEQIGQASAIKMLRSVMIKGIEALTSECALAAHRAGVVDDVFGSMGESWPSKADYNLDRMMVHGVRRAAEMDEVLKTLEDLGVEPLMSRGTVMRQRAIGSLGFNPPPTNLTKKLEKLDINFDEATK